MSDREKHLRKTLDYLRMATGDLENAAREITRTAAASTVVVQSFAQKRELERNAFPSPDDLTLEQLAGLAIRYGKLAAEVTDWAYSIEAALQVKP